MTAKLGQISLPTPTEIRDQMLKDLRLGAIDLGIEDPPVQPGTDWFLLSTAVANACGIGIANISIAFDDVNILTATGEALDKLRVAEGLPEVAAAGATGKLVITVTATTTLTNGTQFVYPNGVRGQVVGTYVNPSDGDEVNVAAIDTGLNTNLAAGQIVRFVSQPAGIATDATVSDGEPLTGGTDEETDARKRERILNARRNKPAGGNWAHLRQMATDSLGTVQDAYVYPAVGGPGSARVVPVKDFDPENNDFSRALSTTALATVRTAVQSQMPTPQEVAVQAAVDQEVDVTVQVTIPESALSGGNGLGWTDAAPWPELEVADGGNVTITTATANDQITVDAETAVDPIAGVTHIAWWSSGDRKFYTALVTAKSGTAGAWALTLDRALVGKSGDGPQAGDYICPAAQNLEKYGDTWVNIFRALGPGENTTDSNRIPRAKRHPYIADEDPSDLSTIVLTQLARSHPEITAIAFGYTSDTTADVPGTVATAPSILIPGKFAVYPT